MKYTVGKGRVLIGKKKTYNDGDSINKNDINPEVFKRLLVSGALIPAAGTGDETRENNEEPSWKETNR
jgi:hypothetical protein